MIQALLLRWLLILILPWLTAAQSSSSNDTSPFTIFAPDTVFFCVTTVLSWTDGNAPFTLYMARGNGPIGNDDSLNAEVLILYTSNTTGVVYVDQNFEGRDDVLRFRVEGNNGVSAVAWSVPDGVCAETSKPADNTVAETITPLASSIPRVRPSTSSPTKAGSSQRDEVLPSGVNDTSSQILSPVPQQTSESPPFTDEGGSTGDEGFLGSGRTITHASAIYGGYTSQKLQTIAPNNSNGESDTTTKPAILSMQSVGIIIGTVVIAILLWVIALVWRWMHRRRPLALKPKKASKFGSMREILSSASTAPNRACHSITAMVSASPRNQTQMQTLALSPAEHESATIPSYGEVIGLYPPLNTPDSSWNMACLPRNPDPGLQLV